MGSNITKSCGAKLQPSPAWWRSLTYFYYCGDTPTGLPWCVSASAVQQQRCGPWRESRYRLPVLWAAVEGGLCSDAKIQQDRPGASGKCPNLAREGRANPDSWRRCSIPWKCKYACLSQKAVLWSQAAWLCSDLKNRIIKIG